MAKEKIYYSNDDKLKRAQEVLGFLTGKATRSDNDIEMKTTFGRVLAEGAIDPKSEHALCYIYEKMGGLIRTEQEQEVHEQKVEEIKKKKRIISR